MSHQRKLAYNGLIKYDFMKGKFPESNNFFQAQTILNDLYQITEMVQE